MATLELTLRMVDSINSVAADAWDACANPSPSAGLRSAPDIAAISPNPPVEIAPRLGSGNACLFTSTTEINPFISHDFLSALEASGSVRARAGWQPMHLLAQDASGTLLGAVPCYVKSHSRGEYVFDHGWADAFERAGGSYYPKLQVSVPFTPATGRRLLVRLGPHAEAIRAAMADALVATCRRSDASSVHVTFLTEPEWQLLGSREFLRRTHQQFHWQNAGYDNFDAFLAALSSRKRKTIRREREDALANGITVHWLTGSDLTESIWDAFFAFYMETGSRKWGRPYLTREFYSLAGEKMRDRILLVMAKRNGRFVAGAINFIGSHALYGRHWGAIEHHPFLHFELCYYQAIKFAIERKLARVEAGAQGEHKVSRGYLPVTTYSAHYIDNPALRRAVDDFLRHERAYVAAACADLTQAGPFRKNLTVEST
jgi:predicted N-acyltransferase